MKPHVMLQKLMWAAFTLIVLCVVMRLVIIRGSCKWYHEQQKVLLCGMHALNNALQERLVTCNDLRRINEEQELNVGFADGMEQNFRAEVLHAWLQRHVPAASVRWGGDTGNLQVRVWAIVGDGGHYKAYRRCNVDGEWYNLDSLLEKPQKVSHDMLLEALRRALVVFYL